MKKTITILILLTLFFFSSSLLVSALEGCHTSKIMGKNCCSPGLNWGEGDGVFWCEGDPDYAENCKSCIGKGSDIPPEEKKVEEIPDCSGVEFVDSEAKFADISGQVEITPDCDLKAWRFAKTNSVIHVYDHVKTAEESSAILSFSDMSTFVLKEESEVIITTPPYRDSKIGLVLGNIWVNMKKMIKDGSMEVDMNQAVLGIKGTTFICEETGSKSIVKVIEGEVEFTSKVTGNTISVGAGETASASSSGLSKVTSFHVNNELDQWRDLGVDTSELISNGATDNQQNDPKPKEIISSLKDHEQNGLTYQWANWNKGVVQNGPPITDTTFSISQPVILTYIDTYHWNFGNGVDKPGEIGLISNDGVKYGPWTVEGEPETNHWWRAYPDERLPAGTYMVIDSDPKTWSNNADSNNAGFAGIQCKINSPVPNSLPDRIFTNEPDIDLLGQDYRYVALNEQDDCYVCEKACRDDLKCVAYSYVKPGVRGSNPECYLKNKIPNAGPDDCCISGILK